jgi:FKBP-type peptidyl-prolyl cis-trans isomerase SlyD
MDKIPNKFMSVEYQLYTIVDGKKSLQEETGSERPFEFITGFGIALDAFEQEVIQHAKGDTFDFTIEPAQAFGTYEPQGVHKLEREVFSINGHFDHENIYPDAVITLTDGEDHQFMARVVKVEEDGVTVDTNHPLAGKTLNFTGTIRENRDATEEEINKTIKMLTGGCHGCGHHHGEGCEDGCCDHDHEHGDGCGCGHCH